MTVGLLQIVDDCNYKCIHCSQQAKPYGRNTQFLSIENAKERLYFLKKVGCESVQITGGEVGLHPQLIEIIRISTNLKLNTEIISNALLINKNLATKLRDNGLKSISYSIYDFDKDGYEKMTRVQNSFQKAISNILYSGALFNEISIYAFLSSKTVEKLKELELLCRLLPITKIKLIQAMGQGRNLSSNHIPFNEKHIDSIIKFGFKMRTELGIPVKLSLNSNNSQSLASNLNRACNMSLSKSISIDLDGYIYPCCLLMNLGLKYSIANIDSIKVEDYEDLVEVWNNETVLNNLLDKKIDKNTCPAIEASGTKDKFICPISYAQL